MLFHFQNLAGLTPLSYMFHAYFQRIRPDNQYVPSSMPFEDKTEYRVSHIGYVAPKEKSYKPEHWSDALGQRDPTNPFHIQKESDWRQMLNTVKPETTVKG